ncbi:MAG: cell division protein FtsA [Thermodesulfovibrio sp.]|nr:cell division protein FtsA [Thermodesulfovibrio sp.]
MRQHIVVGLDVGTTKICGVAAQVQGSEINLLGMGVSPSAGLRKGMVINIDDAVASIRTALDETEACSGVRVRSVSVGISGSHVRGFESCGAVGIRGKEVSHTDVDRAIESARAVYIPLDREVLHVIPTEFILDGQEGITDPVGMSGVRLEAKVHIITGAVSSVQNLLKCCEKAGLDVVDLVFEPLASARAALTRDEKEAGVVLVDIGGGTTDIALFREGSLRHAAVLGVGGNHITNDIAVGLRIQMAEAERLKKTAGATEIGPDQEPEVQMTQACGQVRSLRCADLASIIRPRCEEMLELVREELKRGFGYEHAVYGVVLTGGSSLLRGFDRMAELVLQLPVRIGRPEIIGTPEHAVAPALRNPQYATGVGLVACSSVVDRPRIIHPVSANSLLGRMRHWAKDLFKNAETINPDYKKEGGMVCSKSKK